MKTRKTGGTSVQIALSKYCQDDIITGDVEHPDGTVEWNYGKGLNTERFFTNNPHPALNETKLHLKNIWKKYFKFGFVRNPFEIVVSRYFWDIVGKGRKYGSINGFREWVKEYCNHPRSINDMQYLYLCNENLKIDVDYVGRYETLQKDYDKICERLNLPTTKLGSYKSGYKNIDLHWSDYYDDITEKIVATRFQLDFKVFEYDTKIQKAEFKVSDKTYTCIPNTVDTNINGPSALKLEHGGYALYFAHHQGNHIRLALANSPIGPWEINKWVPLELKNTHCKNHIASPDVHYENGKYMMYFHGDDKDETGQYSYVAESNNPIGGFKTSWINHKLGHFYFRVFDWSRQRFALAKKGNQGCGVLYKYNDDGVYEEVGELIDNMRHCSVLIEDNFLYIFYTRIGDCPEHIRVCKIYMPTLETISDYMLREPMYDDEGVNEPLEKSKRGAVYGLKNQLRDPFIFKDDDDKLYLYFAAGGENSIKVTELVRCKK